MKRAVVKQYQPPQQELIVLSNIIEPEFEEGQITEEEFEEEQKDLHKLPPKLKMIRTFAREIWDLYKTNRNHIPSFVSQDVAEHRITVCGGCPHYTDQGRCSKCGCYMDKKANLVTAKCPLDKWDSVL
jgi:hypothetical protein